MEVDYSALPRDPCYGAHHEGKALKQGLASLIHWGFSPPI